MPRSYIVHLASGNASPWSVVRITRVLSTRPCSSSALSTSPTPWSSDRALALNDAMSRRVIARVEDVLRRARVERVAHRRRLEVLAVGLEEADREEERLVVPRRARRCRRVAAGATSLTRVVSSSLDVVVADVVRVDGDVLLADEARPVAGVAEPCTMWRSGWVEPVAAVGEAEHARSRGCDCPVSSAARDPEHTGAAQNAWRNSTPWSARCWMFGVGTG